MSQHEILTNLDPQNTIQYIVKNGGTLGLMILDESSSMSRQKMNVIAQANNYIFSLQSNEGKFFVGIVSFNESCKVSMHIQDVHTAELRAYEPSGYTLLYVSVYRTLKTLISAIESIPEDMRSKDFHCVVGVYTDGEDNQSKYYDGFEASTLPLQALSKQAIRLGIDLVTFAFGKEAQYATKQMGFPMSEDVYIPFEEVSSQTLQTASQTLTARTTMYNGPQSVGLHVYPWVKELMGSQAMMANALAGEDTSTLILLIDASSSVADLNDLMHQALNGFGLVIGEINDGRNRFAGIVTFAQKTEVLHKVQPISAFQQLAEYKQSPGTRLIGTLHNILSLCLEVQEELSEDFSLAEVTIAVFTDGRDSCSSAETKAELPGLINRAKNLGYKLFVCGIGRPASEAAQEIGFSTDWAIDVKRSSMGLNTATSSLAESWRTGNPPSSQM